MVSVQQKSVVSAFSEAAHASGAQNYSATLSFAEKSAAGAFLRETMGTTHNTPSSDSHLSVMQADLESLTPGELLKTYGIMHNSDMENLAATHAQDALAFANDVSINGHEIEQRQKHVQTALVDLDNLEDDDLTPEQRAKKRNREQADITADILHDINQDRIEQHRKEWDAQMHMIGGHKYSGRELMDLKDFLMDSNNADKFDAYLVDKYKISKDEAKKRREDLQRTLELMEKERSNTLTKEEATELKHNSKNPIIAADLADLKKMEESGRGVTYSNEHTEIEAATTSEIKTSTELRANLLAENKSDITSPTSQTIKMTAQPSIFSSVTSSDIQTGTALTSTYNDKASSIIAEPPANITREIPQQKIATSSPAGNFGFG